MPKNIIIYYEPFKNSTAKELYDFGKTKSTQNMN